MEGELIWPQRSFTVCFHLGSILNDLKKESVGVVSLLAAGDGNINMSTFF